MIRILLLAGAVLALASDADGARPFVYHSGRVHSMIPYQRLLVVEELGARGTARLLLVHVGDADVVRLARDPDRPWEWRKTPTRLRRLPVGTFVVIIGRKRAPRVLEAERIEVPAP